MAHASDADDETRCVVRMVTAALASTSAHRVAVLYGSARPYARLLAEHLDAAGIRWNGSGVRPTVERTLPRALLDLLALPDHGWRRDEVLGVLSAAPVRGGDGNRVPASRWERISRIVEREDVEYYPPRVSGEEPPPLGPDPPGPPEG